MITDESWRMAVAQIAPVAAATDRQVATRLLAEVREITKAADE
ncbi:hypothetical protein ACFWY5_11575 [Nonomuraea sp. NPDC059007]